jgi:hypothetical protein
VVKGLAIALPKRFRIDLHGLGNVRLRHAVDHHGGDKRPRLLCRPVHDYSPFDRCALKAREFRPNGKFGWEAVTGESRLNNPVAPAADTEGSGAYDATVLQPSKQAQDRDRSM